MRTVSLFFGKEYLDWADTLSKDVESIAAELLDTFHNDSVSLYIPLLIDFEYWMINTPDNLIKDQIDLYYKKVILPHKGLIHPFVSFDPARELAYKNNLRNPEEHLETEGSEREYAIGIRISVLRDDEHDPQLFGGAQRS